MQLEGSRVESLKGEPLNPCSPRPLRMAYLVVHGTYNPIETAHQKPLKCPDRGYDWAIGAVTMGLQVP